jgi:hypothetical protein
MYQTKHLVFIILGKTVQHQNVFFSVQKANKNINKLLFINAQKLKGRHKKYKLLFLNADFKFELKSFVFKFLGFWLSGKWSI